MTLPIPILLNAKAGALNQALSPDTIRLHAAELGLEVDVLECESAQDMSQQIRQFVKSGMEKIAVAGGDGTINLAAQELAHSKTALGILPHGTVNNFAKALSLPMELPAAMGVLQSGKVHRIDLGRVGSHYFTEAAGIGLFADALQLYGTHTGKSLPRLLYTVGQMFLSARAHRVRLTLDDNVVVERAVMCTVANSYRMGLGAPVAPDALLTDGNLDVVVIGDLSRLELLQYYHAVMNQTHLDLPKVSSAKARRVTIECSRPMRVHCDDKIVGTTPVVITTETGALRVIRGAT